MRIQNVPVLSGFFSWFRSGLSGLLGLLSLIVLSILFVWPMWYLATSHTRLYSLLMMSLAGGLLILVIFTRFRRIFKTASKRGKNLARTGIQQPGPAEHAE